MASWRPFSGASFTLSSPLLEDGFEQPFSLYSSLLTSPPSRYGPSQSPFSSGALARGDDVSMSPSDGSTEPIPATPASSALFPSPSSFSSAGNPIPSTRASLSTPTSASASYTRVAPHAVPGSELPEWKENVECDECAGPIVVAFPDDHGVCRQCADKRCLVGTCTHSWHQIAPSPIPLWRSQLATDFLNRQATRSNLEITSDSSGMTGKYTMHLRPLILPPLRPRKPKPVKPQRKRSLIGTFVSEKSV